MKRNLICICCPNGCELEVDEKEEEVKGNKCLKGVQYGINEVKNPVRIITSTVKVKDGNFTVAPVKTKSEIPKKLRFECIKEINKVTIKAPVHIGDVIIKNLLNTGVDVVATRNIDVFLHK